MPVAPDGEAVFVRVHIGIGTVRQIEMGADHSRRHGKNLVGTAEIGNRERELVEQPKQGFAFCETALGEDSLRDVEHHR